MGPTVAKLNEMEGDVQYVAMIKVNLGVGAAAAAESGYYYIFYTRERQRKISHFKMFLCNFI